MILVVDNYDSFTWNLVQYLAGLGAEPLVRRNDELTVDEAMALAPSHVVISPGPCTPQESGISMALIDRIGGDLPVLGVCLGHQAIAAVYGGRVVRAAVPMHGKLSAIVHEGDVLFRDVPERFTVTRYHSLTVAADALPPTLRVTARAERDPGDLQALRHCAYRVWGVQFHPESVASEHGMTILKNFLEQA